MGGYRDDRIHAGVADVAQRLESQAVVQSHFLGVDQVRIRLDVEEHCRTGIALAVAVVVRRVPHSDRQS